MKKDTLILSSDQIEYISVLVSDGGVTPLNVTGTSMRPFISPKGDTVYLASCEKGDVKKGDILLFKRNNGSVVLHRVRRVDGDKYIMNGDAQNWCESTDHEHVIARVIEYTHNGKRVDPNSSGQKIIRAFWYPTYKVRPYMIAGLRKIKIIK